MALAAGNAGEFTCVRSPYNLQTQQKRLRHLRTISVRNLHCGGQGSEPLSRLQCYFTLHSDVNAQAFYESEKITGSTNPSWQSFDISQFENQVSLTSKFVVVRVWVGHGEEFRLLIEMDVHFSGLNFLSDKLQEFLVKSSPNTVIFGMLDKEFVYVAREQTRFKHLGKKVSDLELPSSLLPAVVKVERSTVRNSYNTSSLTRIQTVLRAIKQMQVHARRYRRQIEDKLVASQENSQKMEERENLHMSVSQLRQDLLRRTTMLHQSQEKLASLRQTTTERRETVETDTEASKKHYKVLQEEQRDHIVKREQLVKENALLNLRRRQMLNELFCNIYPITQNGTKYYINNVRLPHAEELQGQDEAMVSVGLGYSCHMTIKIAQVLGLPLRHPMENRGSRSVIMDQVTSRLADKDREFPLYSKSKDKNHFNYGVFLLNKNISQLRYQCSVPTLDLRQTLENLLTLMHKLGVRLEGDTTGIPPALTSPPEGASVSRASPNGSSVATNPANLFLTSPNGEAVKSPGSRSGQSAWKTSDNSEDGSVSAAATDSSSTKRAEGGERKPQFDESEELFKPPGDDHFFKVGNSLIDDFNAASGEREQGDPEGLLSAGLVDHESNARMTALLQSASEGERLTGKSFQLLRQSKGTKDQSRDNNNSGIHDNIHHSVDDHGAAKTHGDDDVDGVHQIQSDSSTSPDILSVNGEGRETEHSVVAEVYAEGNSSVL